ncbi:MAG: Hsp20/alpha crystallin family protein [Deltaproteobacteria bacterium]|nr:Hsp20/alpha crystallin family protein [Deltaproteobacteria bacterium]MBW1942176.1 Hsp20/alpha crystallin family protein [Deltaproteobacteria bacterium]MBW2206381.1 Hsp20/alpha crystallin family protein [Deltaproteobacteria bacterium]
MPGLILWKNQELDKMRRDMDRLMDRLWDDFCVLSVPRMFYEEPYFQFTDTEDSLIVEARIPGLKPKEMDVSVTEDILSIKGVIEQEGIEVEGDYRRVQRRSTSLSRTFRLPCRIAVDDTKATYKKGVLKIVMPKMTSPKTRGVPITVKR